jgi:16S rRNA processing protein RimM
MAGARICLGQIGAPHGVRGEVRLHSFTANPTAIATYGPLETEDGRVLQIESLRPAKHAFVAKLSGIADRDAAERLANTKLYVPRERLPEPAEADEFYHADLIGLRAVDYAGRECGTVVAVHNFGAGDLIELRPVDGAATQLLPFDAATVTEVNVRGGIIVINPSPLAGEGGEAKPGPARTRSSLPRKGRG